MNTTGANAPDARRRNLVDRILSLLDNTLEQPAANHHGVTGGTAAAGETCWRCMFRPAAADGTLCAPCGAYLRCETDVDPVPPAPPPNVRPEADELRYYGWWFGT